MTFSLRRRLLMVAALGAIACTLAIYALGRPLAAGQEQRLERSRFAVEQEARRLRVAPEGAATPRRPEFAMFGLRSGLIAETASFDDMKPSLEDDDRVALRDARAESLRTQRLATRERASRAGTLFVATAPADGHSVAWAAYFLSPSKWTPILRVVGVLLGLVSLTLVVASIHTVTIVQREAASLRESLRALSKNLDASVHRPVVAELGDVANGIATLARDLAEAGRERERLHVELAERERLAILGRVTAGLAHELRNPLAVIKLRVDMACRKNLQPDEIETELFEVSEEVARLDRLANDLLTMGGRQTGAKSLYDLATLAQHRAAFMGPMLDERGVQLRVVGSASAPLDVDSIARVIDNLERNAVEASPPNGEVLVEVSETAGRAIVRVIDRGPGVPAAREAELFEPFFTTKPDGVGLGLALSRAIAAAHRGTLTYRRESDRTVFELALPLSEPPAS